MKVNKIINSTVEEELEITGATLLSVEEAKEYTDYVNPTDFCSKGKRRETE